MATIKSYSDLDQSRKLAEFLPLESADMFYIFESITGELRYHPIIITEQTNRNFIISEHNSGKGLVSWSLAALLAVLPDHFYDETGRKKFGMDKGDHSYYVFYETQNSYIQTSADNPVDACYEMILKLHELKKL